jgi:hypothetical protein
MCCWPTPAPGCSCSRRPAKSRPAGEFRGAYLSLKRALTIFQAAYGHDHEDLIEVLSNLGILQPGKITQPTVPLYRYDQRI